MSLKWGEGERVTGGRAFVCHRKETIAVALAGIPVAIDDAWISSDVRAGRTGEHWLNVLAHKT